MASKLKIYSDAPGGLVFELLPVGIQNRGSAQQPTPTTELTKTQFIALLQKHKGNIAALAKALGMTRQSVHRRLEKYGVRADDYRE